MSYRSKLLKCYRKWHLLLLHQIYVIQIKGVEIPIYSMAKWAGGHKLSLNITVTI